MKHCSRRAFLKSFGIAAGALVLTRAGAYAQAPTLTIGVLYGSKLPLGLGILNGAQLAGDELRYRVIPADLDNEGDPARVRSALSALAGQGAQAIVGAARSETVAALLPELPRLKVPVLITGTPVGGTDQVAANYANLKYLFRVGVVNQAAQIFDGGQFAGEFLSALLKSGKLPGKGEVALTGDAPSGDFRNALMARLNRVGLSVIGNLSDPQPAALLERLQRIGVSAAVTVFFDAAYGAAFTTAWSQNKVKIGLFGWNEALLSGDLGGAATGYLLADFAAESPKVGARTAEFYSNYSKRFGARPAYTAATTYDALYALSDAARRAGTTDGERLVTALEGIRLNGVVGLIRFYSIEEQNRDPLKLAVAHDQVYGLNRAGGAPAFDGVRPFYVQLRAGGQRVALYPSEYAVGSYELPPHFS
ncbi:ABC transporter substrate-binding protein [Candidatus Acetothermia bacterium]|jgi:branched-chain amino acid transport system substrate-binding protein|nr:ABC transporter substrate-binding protein [Candidatus Acetothermia bacterium]MCI2431665.1 ABC transporter substrate-binding protein [Candidatus Acetothermia bacterium]MCI2436381.1 ABC transporter substrate-binding protein [Candidatus Acetothermia bacterium]